MFNAFLILKDGQLLTWMLWISKVVFIIKTNILIGLRVSKLTANLNFGVNHLFNNPKSYLDGWIGLWMIDLHSLSTHRWHDISTVEISHCFSLLCTGELQKGLTQSTKKTSNLQAICAYFIQHRPFWFITDRMTKTFSPVKLNKLSMHNKHFYTLH